MSTIVIKNNIISILSKRIVHHLLFWGVICFIVLLISTDEFNKPVIYSLKIMTELLVSGLVLVYPHFYIFERYLDKKRYYTYALILIGFVLIGGELFQLYFSRIYVEEYSNSHFNTYGNVFGIIFISTSLKLIKRWIRQNIELEAIKAKHFETELKLLKSQINPHFFFNTLNNLYSLSLEKSEEVPGVILKLSDLMRYLLDSAKKKEVPLIKEYDFINNYLSLEKLRYSKRCDIKMNIEGDMSGKVIAPMLLIPFVENSFKHGVSSTVSDSYVQVILNIEQNDLNFSVENSKPEKPEDVNNSSSQMGLKNVRRRLELLYPQRHKLDISETKDMFKITLEIKL